MVRRGNRGHLVSIPSVLEVEQFHLLRDLRGRAFSFLSRVGRGNWGEQTWTGENTEPHSRTSFVNML